MKQEEKALWHAFWSFCGRVLPKVCLSQEIRLLMLGLDNAGANFYYIVLICCIIQTSSC